jgi:diguanylate cyclase (GGDEF)-like protein/PAS domain S-box-containing protein
MDERGPGPGDRAGTVPDEERRDEANARLRLVLENSVDVIVQYDLDGTLLWASPSLRHALGWAPDAVVGTHWEITEPADRPLLERALADALARGDDTLATRSRVRTADGGTRWVHGVTRIVRDDDGGVSSLVSNLRDISEQVATEQALIDSERHYRMLADNATDVVIHSGADGLIAWVSPSVQSILGRSPQDLIGARVVDFMHPADVARTRAIIREALALGETGGRTEVRFDTGDGRWRWMSMVGRALLDPDGRVVGGIDTLRDIQSEHDAREELRRMATRDPLTGLANRRQLMARLAVALGHRSHRDVRAGVLFVDVDRLKAINDEHGHQVGDDVLVELAARVDAAVGVDDVVARFGGDEFVVLLTDVSSVEHAARVATTVHAALAPPVRVGTRLLDVSVSIGLALAAATDTPDTLLRRADTALYRAKTGGRGRTEAETFPEQPPSGERLSRGSAP